MEVNEHRLKATAEVAPELVEREVRLLCQMKPEGKVLRLIEKHPEATGILLLAHKKEPLAAAILGAPEPDQDMLVASYLFSTTGTEVEQWTQAVARHPGPIALFQRRCAALPYQGLFSYLGATPSLQPEARHIYGQWLDEVLALPVISQSDERMQSRLNFAATCGPEVRRRLASDPAFRENFLEAIWPRFRESMIDLTQSQGKDSQDVFAYCGGEPLVWDFFKREDSATLFKQVGMEAVLLLEGRDALRPDIQKVVVPMWSKGILELPQRLQRFQDNRDFLTLVRLLQDEADWPLLNGACIQLEQKQEQWPAEAAYFAGLSKSALNKEIHPEAPSMIPGAALFSLGARFLDGRRVGAGDWLGAGLDVVDFAVVIASVGTSEVLTTAAKAGIKQTLRTAAEESAEKIAGRTLKDLSERKSTEWTQGLVNEALTRLPGQVREAVVRAGVVDITEPVKAGFQLSRNLGMGREPFKSLSGMEARLFMRQDGRVFINFTNVITNPSPAASFLTRTIENGVLQSSPVEDSATEAAALLHQWKEDVSAWWTGHATGQF